MTVLVLRALGLGDALTGVAALRGVRRAWPDHRLVLAAPRPLAEWFRDLHLADSVLATAGLGPLPWPWAGPGGASDGPACIAVNLHGRGPQSHRVLQATQPTALVGFGSATAHHDGPAWDDEEHEVLRWCRLVSAAGGPCGPGDLRLAPPVPTDHDGPVVVHPGAAAAARRWPVGRWAEVVAQLVARGEHVVLTGNADERETCARVRSAVGHHDRGALGDTAGRLGLPELAALVASARLLVSADTGVAHLATAYGTPSVTLFGPTPPALWGPVIDTDRHAVLWHGHPGDPRRDANAPRLDPALEALGADEVVAACHTLLTGTATAA